MQLVKTKIQEYTEAYSNLFPLVYSMVYSKIGNADDTHDICQEVFTRFYLKFDEIENYRKWIYGTLRYVILEFLRKKKNQNDIDISDVFQDISVSYVNGFKDTRILIEEALDNINNFDDDNDKVLFDLVAVRNFSYRQAAHELGITIHKVKYRYSVIIQRVLDYLKDKGINSLEDLL